MEKWILVNRRADLKRIAETFHIDPLVAKLMRNRDIIEDRDIQAYLYPSLKELYDPFLLKDMKKAVEIVKTAIEKKQKIMAVTDFDCDGICTGYILKHGLEKLGADVCVEIPERIRDGYGINSRIVQDAADQGVKLIITGDNGIAAKEIIEEAKSYGIKVVVTDHHEVPYTVEKNKRVYQLPDADAVVDPKRQDCPYPYDGICGAVVAWKLIQAIYMNMGFGMEKAEEFLPFAAIATVADVMDLRDENRIIVKNGLSAINQTNHIGLRELIRANGLEQVTSYSIGFVLGPCLNSSGRLKTADLALKLLDTQNVDEAKELAAQLKLLNQERKELTEKGIQQAKAVIEENKLYNDSVLLVKLSEVHESIVGIIAGRVKETYNRPVIVLTNVKDGLKGSGRSVEQYDIFEKVNQFKGLLKRFGGHPMACGLSMEEANVDKLREGLNGESGLREEDLVPTVRIDAQVDLSYFTEDVVCGLEVLEPFGKGNTKPVFGEKQIKVMRLRYIGQNNQYLRLTICNKSPVERTALFFGEAEQFVAYFTEKYGRQEVDKAFRNQKNKIEMTITYYPQINVYNGVSSVQFIISHYR
ncbi:single-stranded-DNA-specific exonuclease RecJ [Aminipila luticellarii]|nr:single-stranded-DNA-specific exonuclease RecJ [Aminipila luticellarii]